MVKAKGLFSHMRAATMKTMKDAHPHQVQDFILKLSPQQLNLIDHAVEALATGNTDPTCFFAKLNSSPELISLAKKLQGCTSNVVDLARCHRGLPETDWQPLWSLTKAISKDKDTIDFEKWGVPEPVPVPEHVEDEKEEPKPKKVTFTRQARTRTLGRPVSRQWAI